MCHLLEGAVLYESLQVKQRAGNYWSEEIYISLHIIELQKSTMGKWVLLFLKVRTSIKYHLSPLYQVYFESFSLLRTNSNLSLLQIAFPVQTFFLQEQWAQEQFNPLVCCYSIMNILFSHWSARHVFQLIGPVSHFCCVRSRPYHYNLIDFFGNSGKTYLRGQKLIHIKAALPSWSLAELLHGRIQWRQWLSLHPSFFHVFTKI